MPSFHMFGNEFDAMLELILYTLLSLFLYMCVCVCARARLVTIYHTVIPLPFQQQTTE
jgi:hypothetical protein